MSNHSTCANDTPGAKFDVPGDYGIGADPYIVADGNGASPVRLRSRWRPWGDAVVRRSKHNVGTDDDIVAEPDCSVSGTYLHVGIECAIVADMKFPIVGIEARAAH